MNGTNTTCTRCGKTFAGSVHGGLSSWLFRKAECQCELERPAAPPGSAGAKPIAGPPSNQKAVFQQLKLATERITLVEQQEPNAESLLPEQYKVLEQLGSGGMGVVYKAQNKYTNRIVAIKMLINADVDTDDTNRFKREAAAACAFTHANAVSVIDFGVWNEVPFLVMEFVEGQSLETVLQANTLDEQTTVSIATSVCEALAEAHKAGVIHRDIKPSNIMLTPNGDGSFSAKILDFGLAKLTNSTSAQDLTKTGDVLGTPHYMSPEQFTGRPADQRSDVYAVGTVMYRCLAGKPPHAGDSAYEVMYRRLNERPSTFAQSGVKVSPKLESIIFKCLEVDLSQRYQSASELLGDLKNFAQGKSVKIRRSLLRLPAKLTIKQTSLIAGICVLLAGALFLQVSRLNTPVENRTTVSNPTDWNSYDLRGQNYLNQGKYDLAKADFEKCVALSGTNDQHKLITLQKIALLQHIRNEASEEKETDKRIAALKTSMKTTGVDVAALQKSLLLLPDKPTARQLPQISALSEDILATAQAFNKRFDPASAIQLIDAALPPMTKHLGEQSVPVLKLVGEKAESLLQQDQYEKAVPLAQKAINGLVRQLPKNDLALNTNIVRLVDIANEQYGGTQSEPYAKMVIENLSSATTSAAKSVLARAHIGRGISIANQVRLEDIKANRRTLTKTSPQLDEAEKEIRLGLNIDTDDLDPEVLEFGLRVLGSILAEKSSPDEAAKTLLESAKRTADMHPLLRAEYLDAAGNLYLNQRNSSSAEPYFREALSLQQHYLAPESQKVLFALRRMGTIAYELNWYGSSPFADEHESMTKQQIAILERRGASRNKAELAYTNIFDAELAYILYRKNDRAGARYYVNRILKVVAEQIKKNEDVFNAFGDKHFAEVIEYLDDKDAVAKVRKLMDGPVRNPRTYPKPQSNQPASP